MTFAEALRAARPLIKSGRKSAICYALAHVCPEIDSAQFQRRIIDQLYPCIYYESWVFNNHPDTYEMMNGIRGAFRAGRLAWIDDMIAKEEAK